MKHQNVCRSWKSYMTKGRQQLCKKIPAISLSITSAASFLPANITAAAAAKRTAASKQYVSMRTTSAV